uniref:Reverse transcriptase domain-containing protein n=1 Tax=Tanacetum cinerariifolium TaxID=118510 RepID=A0A699H1G5_TANCI|nr:reverse transcriptase domain-containing protein [Tanacetum cinerariifolium]
MNPHYIGPFKILAKVGTVAYRLELLEQLSRVHSTFHVLNLKKCLYDKTLAISLDEIQIDKKLRFIGELVEIIDREVKRLKQSRILIVKASFGGVTQSSVAMSSAKPEYVVAAGCCAQVLWIKSQLGDYDVLYDKVPIFCDNTSAIVILNNPVLHSKKKHIDNRALTLQPTAMYVQYLKEFWYIAEVEDKTKTITLLLSWWDKPLSFTQDKFISAIGLTICKDSITLPSKETVRAGLETLGLFDKDKPTLSSTVLVNSSPLKM